MANYDDVYAHLASIDVEYSTKGGLKYLSWAKAVDAVAREYPGFQYWVHKFDPVTGEEKGTGNLGVPVQKLPDDAGYMVATSVRIGDDTRAMWLPVMDDWNNPVKSHPYQVAGEYCPIEVRSIDSALINKAIMRCLVKNLAMFGLGISLYAGEDISFEAKPVNANQTDLPEQTSPVQGTSEEQEPERLSPAQLLPESALLDPMNWIVQQDVMAGKRAGDLVDKSRNSMRSMEIINGYAFGKQGTPQDQAVFNLIIAMLQNGKVSFPAFQPANNNTAVPSNVN